MILHYILLSVVVILLAGLIVNNYLTGRRFLRDFFHHRLIRKFKLKVLDKKWENAEHRSDIIISFTTIPSRIAHIEPTIKSFLYQERLPKKIILNIPYRSFRGDQTYEIPKWLSNLKSLEIRRIDHDFGPASKFIPTLEAIGSDQLVLVLDDDHIYPRNYVKDFETSGKKYPEFLLTASGWRVPKDLIDKPTSLISNITKSPPTPVKSTRIRRLYKTDIVQGYAGYLIKPSFFDVDRLKDYTDAPEQLKYVDDVWISAHANVPKYIFPMKRYCYSAMSTRKFFKSTSLSIINNRVKVKNEDRHNSIAIGHFKDKWDFSE